MACPSPKLRALCFVLSLFGAVLCAALLRMHSTGEVAKPLAFVCRDADDACLRATRSAWAWVPPRAPDSPASLDDPIAALRLDGVPVAWLGLAYFSILLVLFGSVSRLPSHRRARATLVELWVGAGGLGSLFYSWLLVFELETLCPLCLAVHAANLAVLGFVVFGRLGARWGAVRERIRPTDSWRPTFARLSLSVAVLASEWFAYRAASLEPIVEYAAKLRSDGALLEAIHRASPRHATNAEDRAMSADATEPTLGVRRDDPALLPRRGGRVETLVVYSDVACEACARFDRFLDEIILPLYGGSLRVVFKHAPAPRRPRSLTAARALEAARLQGKFFLLRRLLHRERRRLEELDYRAVAEELGLDVPRFLSDLQSSATLRRVREDQRCAKALGLRSTPGVFLGGRYVAPEILDLEAFWRRRAEALRALRDSRSTPSSVATSRPAEETTVHAWRKDH